MIIREVTCPVCGCACDDIEVRVEGNRIIEVRNACTMGTKKFLSVNSENRLRVPFMRDGNEFIEVKWERAIKESAKILYESNYPLLYGWSETSCEAIKVGVDIAELLGGFIDNQSSHCHSPTIIAEQRSGFPLCTLGMAINYADFIIYWGSNPEESHPRHLSHFTAYTRGIYTEGGRRDRKIAVIDVRKTKTAKLANFFFQIKPNSDIELISALRVLLRGHELNEKEIAGLKVSDIKKLLNLMKGCNYGIVFIGLGLVSSLGKVNNVEALFDLIKEINNYTRFSIIPMRGHYNVAGFTQVLTWRSGYPFAVDYSRGYPYYNPGETSVIDLLCRKEIDAMLCIAADPVSHFPRKAVERIAEIPLITIDITKTPTTYLSDIVIPGVICGIESTGTYYRMDNVPLTAKKIIDPPFKFVSSDEEIMQKIYYEIKRLMKDEGTERGAEGIEKITQT